MAVKLINKEVVKQIEVDGAVFKYRQLTLSEKNNIIKGATVAGEIDNIKFSLDILKAVLVGWDGVITEDDQVIEYKPELIELLPENTIFNLISTIFPTAVEEAEKN